MVRPAVSPAAEDLYAALGATTVGDDRRWILLHLCEALTQPLALIDDLAADTPDHPGWSSLLDVDRCPPWALGFMAQFVGVTLLPGLDDASQRLRIAGAAGWQRGTPASIIAAAQQWLSGARRVVLTERYGGSAYAVRVLVYESEAVDVDQLTIAINGAVPAGIVATVTVTAGWLWSQLETIYAGQTYADLETAFAGQTYADFERVIP